MKRIALAAVTLVLLALQPILGVAGQTLTTLWQFGGSVGDGYYPAAGLLRGNDGNFYGTTSAGGEGGAGSVFRISPSGTYTSLYSFGTIGSPGNDGSDPVAGLVQGSDGNFYGTTELGGTYYGQGSVYYGGTVFRISASGSYAILYSFGSYPTDGSYPEAGLVQGSDSNFYGTTNLGGTDDLYSAGYGTIFRISPSGTYTSLYSFVGTPDGQSPVAGLVRGSDGNFYGTTEYGGATFGTIFRVSPSGSYASLYWFGVSPNDGKYPATGLVQGSDSNFYGTTSSGGTNPNCCDEGGTVFRVSPSGTETNLHSFGVSPNDGSYPQAGLVQGSDGNFYGTTSSGGTYSGGTVFRISPSGTYTTLYSFGSTPADGARPVAGLVQGIDGNFYGTTSEGGTNGEGTVFKLAVAGNGSTGGGCTGVLNAASVSLPAKGGTKKLSVKTKDTDCSWTAVSNDPFITITSGNSGTGKSKVVYTVPGNTNTTALTGTMTIAGQTFTVNQAAGGCKFSLSPKAGKIKAAGGAATIKVKPNFNDCVWSADSNDSFITITDGASGTGKGTVSYTVAANTNTTALTGSITIAGEAFTVTQAGVK
ncbi:MAG: choice-of-anchor tandem repeat GloVer-containing protein [Verrucomicrobiia bacterium]